MVLRLYQKHVAFALCIGIILCTFSAAAQRSAKWSISVPILMYHHISEKPSSWGAYVISPAQFEQDLDFLKQNGYTTVTTKQLIDFEANQTPLPKKPVLITFDDGYESFYAYAFPLLKSHQYTAVFSVIGSEVDRYSAINDHNLSYSNCTWSQLQELYQSGIVELGNHTYNLHKFGQRKGCMIMPGENKESYREMLKLDLEKMQLAFQKHNISTNIFTYPFGKKCESAAQVVEELQFQISFGCAEKNNVLYGNSLEELNCLNRFNRSYQKSAQSILSSLR